MTESEPKTDTETRSKTQTEMPGPAVNIQGNMLILSLPDANSPVVWRMDIKENASAAFEVREQDGAYALVMKGSNGEISEIASYQEKDQAARVLMMTNEVLMEGGGADPLKPKKKKKKPRTAIVILKWFFASLVTILLVLIMVQALQNMQPGTNQSFVPQGTERAVSPDIPPPPQGEPVSAEEFLGFTLESAEDESVTK